MGALELLESPDIAIVQHTSGVLRVAHNLFETGISFLTDLVYTAIAFNCGSGDYPCFLGHNAFLRWKAIQSVAFQDSDSGGTKFWSEDHVSEDFQLSLKLQTAGFGMRLASYHGEEFKEGVSLTVFDELARWEKYAYGINELVFNPLRKFYKGPITGTYLKYFMSSVKPSSKLMVLSYTFTYYALAIPLPLTLANYLLVGWFPGTLDQFYITSWKIIVVMLIIFNVIVSPPLPFHSIAPFAEVLQLTNLLLTSRQ
jgi:cellulose synthase/poly-beta-1,6-N-acetylglucosamine synthase-like glycosyltransferase